MDDFWIRQPCTTSRVRIEIALLRNLHRGRARGAGARGGAAGTSGRKKRSAPSADAARSAAVSLAMRRAEPRSSPPLGPLGEWREATVEKRACTPQKVTWFARQATADHNEKAKIKISAGVGE